MEHLSSLDASFVHLETPETPMHVASLLLLELPDGYTGNFYEEVKKLIANRLHLARVMHRKLAPMPFELGDPVWIEDDDIDIDYHVRHVLLPQPGTMEQLDTLVARLHSSALDRSRPLWEIYVIEGLQNGQIGYYNKIHHSGIDGKAGTELANVLYDTTPEPRVFEPPARRQTGSYQLGITEMFEAGLRNAATQYAKLAQMWPKAAEVMNDLAGAATRLADRSQGGAQNVRPAPRTLFNVGITNQRSFAGMQIPLADMKALAKRHGATLNDIVMAVCAGGVRKFLEVRNALPDEPLQAGVPASLREPGDKSMNNQVTMVRISLATDIADPAKRLEAIRNSALEFEGDARPCQRHYRHGFPDDRLAMDHERFCHALRQIQSRRSHAAIFECGDLQRSRPTENALCRRRENGELFPGFDSLSWQRIEHHRPELCGLDGFRPDGVPSRHAAIGALCADQRHEGGLCRTRGVAAERTRRTRCERDDACVE